MIPAATQPTVTPNLAAGKARPEAAAVDVAFEPVALKPSQASPIEPPARPSIQYDPEKLRSNLQAAIEDLNKQMSKSGRNLGFSMDETLNGPIVTVKNSSTGEVVRQIPSEAVVRVAHTLHALKGLLYDQVA